ncbi:MAG: hypothetical protein RMJ19_02765 [Gemmatales bacterium]|nr:hypothetical protein [Gemmatales bacterium]MCS7159371.1 hypothetical protein [Gemmatales bacterium]MDW8174570.1 hypothetical protein [Gemmatales bacterium]
MLSTKQVPAKPDLIAPLRGIVSVPRLVLVKWLGFLALVCR